MIQTAAARTSLPDFVKYGYTVEGWSFTPLAGKRPILTGWQSRERESLDEALTWTGQGNVGIRCGRASKVIIIDVDPGGNEAPLSIPGTVTAKTGRGGRHYYLRLPAGVVIGNSAGKLGEHIDVRGEGGQCVFPGSTHPDTGQKYEWVEGLEPWTVEVAECPQWIIDMLLAPKKAESKVPPAFQSSVQDRYVKAALNREDRAVRTAPEGSRNETLNKAAFNLGTLVPAHVSREEVETVLTMAARAAGLEEVELAATIKSGIEAGTAHPRQMETAKKPAPAPAEVEDAGGSRYVLIPGTHTTADGEYLETSNKSFAEAVLARLPAGALYRKDTAVGTIRGEAGKRRFTLCTPHRMMLVIDEHLKLGKWVTRKEDDKQVIVYQPCRKEWADVVKDEAETSSHVRELVMMASYPFYAPGFVRVEPGWHDGYFYDEPAELKGLVPEQNDEEIRSVLDDLVCDFPFKTPADRQNFFGLMLTPLIVSAVEGNRPIHLIHATLERTGKTKLAEEVLGGAILGTQTAAMQLTEREEERDKRVLGLLLMGETILHLDNLPPYIDSAVLSSLATATHYRGRILGVNRIVSLVNNLTVVASGNNVQATGELVKRVIPIMLQPKTATPEDRTDFSHKNLRAFVREQRRDVLACLLGMIEHWIKAGKRPYPNPMGGFEQWSESVGGILASNGMVKWRGNERKWRASGDPQGQEMLALATVWNERYGPADVAPREVRRLAEELDLFAHLRAKASDQAVSVAFGRLLQRHTDTPVGPWIIRFRAIGTHRAYRLEVLPHDPRQAPSTSQPEE